MAQASVELVRALRVTAERLARGAEYRWTNMGACNCGHLAQTLTRRSKEEILWIAMDKAGEWAEQAVEYCPDSGYPMDHIIGTMLEAGLSPDDIAHLEKLSCPRVLRALPVELRLTLSFREREHVVQYLRTWADLLEAELPDRARLPRLVA